MSKKPTHEDFRSVRLFISQFIYDIASNQGTGSGVAVISILDPNDKRNILEPSIRIIGSICGMDNQGEYKNYLEVSLSSYSDAISIWKDSDHTGEIIVETNDPRSVIHSHSGYQIIICFSGDHPEKDNEIIRLGLGTFLNWLEESNLIIFMSTQMDDVQSIHLAQALLFN